MLAIANSAAYCPPEILVRWLSGRKQRFAKAPYPKRVPRVRIPPSPFYTNRAMNRSAQVDGQVEQEIKRARAGRFQVRPCNSMAAGMDEQSDKEIASKKQRDQMLKLVAKGFYNELINYGVGQPEVIRVASHLLDNLLAKGKRPDKD